MSDVVWTARVDDDGVLHWLSEAADGSEKLSESQDEVDRSTDRATGKMGLQAAAVAALAASFAALNRELEIHNRLQKEGDQQAFDLRAGAALLGTSEAVALGVQQTGVDFGFGDDGLFALVEAVEYGLSGPAAEKGLERLGLERDELGDTPLARSLSIVSAAQQQIESSELPAFFRRSFGLRREQASGLAALDYNLSEAVERNISLLPDDTQELIDYSIQNAITEQRTRLDESIFGGRVSQAQRDFREGKTTWGSVGVEYGIGLRNVSGAVGAVPIVGGLLSAPLDSAVAGLGATDIDYHEQGVVTPRNVAYAGLTPIDQAGLTPIDQLVGGGGGELRITVNGLEATAEMAAKTGGQIADPYVLYTGGG